MTCIYLIRHCQPDCCDCEDRYRPLTAKGLGDVPKVTAYLSDKNIDVVYCSPYKRSIDTISNFCDSYGYQMNIVEDFREVNIGNDYQGEFMDTVRRLWDDFTYKLSDGESYGAVQKRCVAQLLPLLEKHEGQHVAVSMHSTALSTIINYFKPDFVWDNYFEVLCHTPYVAVLSFDKNRFCGVEYHHFD